jgi:hypothetical protein
MTTECQYDWKHARDKSGRNVRFTPKTLPMKAPQVFQGTRGELKVPDPSKSRDKFFG